MSRVEALRRALPPSASMSVVIDRSMIARYAGACGDFNPLHLDDDFARRIGHPSAFAPGMLIGGLLAHHVTARFGSGSLRKFRTRFVARVWPGERVTVSSVPRRWNGDELAVELIARNDQGDVVAVGGAVIQPDLGANERAEI